MTKNIEDLFYRGDSLESMGELWGRLREDSKKYRKAAVRINWELLLKQVVYAWQLSYRNRLADHLAVRAFRWSGACHLHLPLLAIFLISFLFKGRVLGPPCMNVCIVNTSVVAGYNPPILECKDSQKNVLDSMSRSHPLLHQSHLLPPCRKESDHLHQAHSLAVHRSMAAPHPLYRAFACQ